MRLQLLIFSAAIYVIPGLAHAEVDKGLATCAAIENTVSRLACFDSLSAERGAAPSTRITASNGAGKWDTTTKTDPLTDKKIYFASLQADSGRSRYGRPQSLVIRCQENTTEMYINWNDYLGSEQITTTYRIDKNSAKKSRWPLSTDKKSAFFPGSPVSMLKELAESTSFVANVTPYNENPVTVIFDTTGADKALADIRKGCNW